LQLEDKKKRFIKNIKKGYAVAIIDLLCFVVVEMVELLVMRGLAVLGSFPIS
jgi:hypothetical protein